MEELLKLSIQHGIPAVILGFVLWFIIKPMTDAFIRNVNKNTEVQDQILLQLRELKEDHNETKSAVKDIQKGITQILNSK